MAKELTYKRAGVDIAEADKFISLIKPLAKGTYTKGVISGIGGFGASFSAGFKGLKDPVLVSSTDGVGTKLKVALMAGRHDTIGIDLVAMCVNDVVTTGAEPLFFLDYLAVGKLDARKAKTIIGGIARGCRVSGCALIGGETAEMPGLYAPNDYDLAGFSVGVVDRNALIDGKGIKPGDKIIGLSSSGLHSNGYSLARKLFFEKLNLKLKDRPAGFRKTIGATLLTPTRIYVKAALTLVKSFRIKGIAHITGGGFTENLPRILPPDVKAVIRQGSWPVPFIFRYMQEKGNITDEEMRRTFNLGIGMALVAGKNDEKRIVEKLRNIGEKPYSIGDMEKRGRKEKQVEFRP